MYAKLLAVVCLCSFVLIACTPNQNDTGMEQQDFGQIQAQHEDDEHSAIQVFVGQDQEHRLEALRRDEQILVSVPDLFEVLGYEVHYDEENGTIQAGFTDVLYELQPGTNRVTVDVEEKEIPGKVVSHRDQTWVSLEDLETIFSPDYEVQYDTQTLFIRVNENQFEFPADEQLEEAETEGARGEGENFEDEDAGEGAWPADSMEDSSLVDEEFAAYGHADDRPVVSRGQAENIYHTARQLINTPYEFGADPGDTSQMDCSSFTQYVFGVHGIDLPRTSRAQARMGDFVPAAQLRAGDLVFFSWPGRYHTDQIVGHVGIYLQDGHIIHATPNEGVHIVDAAGSRYWNNTYLGAKRVGS